MSEREGSPVALVTGAATGIGAEVAARLVASGHAVAVCDVDSDGLSAVAEHIGALAVPLDVTDAKDVADAVALVASELGVPTTVLTAAGIMRVSPFLELAAESWERTLAVNLTGTFHVLQACSRAMVEASLGGAMVAVASVAARGPRPDAADYAASKAGIVSLVQSAAVALAPHGIRANAICPGVVDTAMTRRTAAARAAREGITEQEALAALVSRVPLGRSADVAEIAAVAGQLLAPDFGYVTGQAINVCGGLEFD